MLRAAHIKRHTEGTSNELSFSVLDSLKNAADAEEGKDVKVEKPRFGGIALFSLAGRKKTVSTPMKDDVLPLSGAAPQVDNTASFSAPAVLGGGALADISGNARPAPASGATAGLGQPALPALPAPKSKAPSYASPAEEIATRKARRRRSRVSAAVLAAVVIIGLVGGAGYFLYSEFQNHQSNVSVLDQSLGLLTKADEVILPLNTLVNASANETPAADIDEVLAKIPETQSQLTQAKSLAMQASEGMRDSSDKEIAERASAAADARGEMLVLGEQLLQADGQASAASEQMQQAWATLLEADKLSREAAEMVTETTNENVTASKDKTNEAINQFNEALYLVNAAAESYPEADLHTYQDYINKRIEALQHAIASDDAILAQNKQAADDENTAYNLADEEAAAMAKDFPSDPAQQVLSGYEANTSELREQYFQARSRAAAADAFLRDYLGTGTK